MRMVVGPACACENGKGKKPSRADQLDSMTMDPGPASSPVADHVRSAANSKSLPSAPACVGAAAVSGASPTRPNPKMPTAGTG